MNLSRGTLILSFLLFMMIQVNSIKPNSLNQTKKSIRSFLNAMNAQFIYTFNYFVRGDMNKNNDKNNHIRSPSVLTIKKPSIVISKENHRTFSIGKKLIYYVCAHAILTSVKFYNYF